MRSFRLLLPILVLLSGCETVNDAFVRQWHMDRGLNRKVRHQIQEGLERRQETPPQTGPGRPAPAFMDEG